MKISTDLIPGYINRPGIEFFEKKFFLTAGETDSRGRMPIKLIAARSIEIATDHSNVLGVGYADLAEINLRWVLVRITVEVERYPEINEPYSLRTWIEGASRFFTNRSFLMADAEGQTLARINTIWAAIDSDSREKGSLDRLPKDRLPVTSPLFSISRLPTPSISPDVAAETYNHNFGVTDIDFNRHVNALSYLAAALNTYGLGFYDTHTIRRLDIAFEHECYYNHPVEILVARGCDDSGDDIVEIWNKGENRAAALRFRWVAD